VRHQHEGVRPVSATGVKSAALYDILRNSSGLVEIVLVVAISSV
jgi:hypothetical protein